MPCRNCRLSFAGAALLALASGCANTQVTRTGFLDDYAALEPAPERTVAFIPDEIDYFEKEGVAWSSYDSVVIEPTVYRPREGAHPLDAEGESKLTRAFDEQLAHRLGERLDVVETPGAHTLRLRAAITEVDPERVWVNILTVILLVPFDMGGVSGELEIQDAQSGERLLAMSACRDGTPLLLLECFTRYGHARHGMKKWSKMLGRIVTPEAGEGTAVAP